MSEPSATQAQTEAAWRAVRGPAPGLEGSPARIALQIAGAPAGTLCIDEHGSASIEQNDDATTKIDVDAPETLRSLLAGEISPIVAALQGRLEVQGDVELVISTLLGLEAGSPWASAARGSRPS